MNELWLAILLCKAGLNVCIGLILACEILGNHSPLLMSLKKMSL
ncbi:MAG: hypothetical protein JWP78_656 [Mucilaginibacter sp.]|nr:hypothetical protein [Mucilaginibacter sp.]